MVTDKTGKTLLAGFLRWKGDCGGKKQLWFPANYVEEISPSAAEPDRTVRNKLVELLTLNFMYNFYVCILL